MFKVGDKIIYCPDVNMVDKSFRTAYGLKGHVLAIKKHHIRIELYNLNVYLPRHPFNTNPKNCKLVDRQLLFKFMEE